MTLYWKLLKYLTELIDFIKWKVFHQEDKMVEYLKEPKESMNIWVVKQHPMDTKLVAKDLGEIKHYLKNGKVL